MGTTRALRVALIQSGRIVEDRTFTGRTKITVGTDAKSTFLVPLADVPVSTAVFDVTRRGTALLFTSQSEGRVSLSGADAPLQAYAARATSRGAQLSLALPDDAKGRLSIGEVSLLFQFVEAPKPQLAAELPKGARGLVAQLDRSFLAILALSLGVHFAGAGYLSNQPVPEERDLTIEELSVDRFARVLMPLPPPKHLEQTPSVVAAVTKPKVTEPVKPRVANTRPSSEAIKERVRTMGMIGVIGSKGDGESGFGDILKDTGMKEVADAMRDAKHGLSVASVDDATAGTRKGTATGITSMIETLGTEGVKEVGLAEQRGTVVAGRVTTERVQVDAPEVDEATLSRWLQGRKPGIQGCYERELKRTPTLHGRLVIRFAITSRGRVGAIGFDEDSLRSAPVQLCISTLMRGWALPFKPDDDVPVALPFIFTAGT